MLSPVGFLVATLVGLVEGQLDEYVASAAAFDDCTDEALWLLQLTSRVHPGGRDHHEEAKDETPRKPEEDTALLATGSAMMSNARARSLLQRVAVRADDVVWPTLNIVHLQKPWDAGVAPLASCAGPVAPSAVHGGVAEAHLFGAVKRFCDAGLGDQVEFYVDPRFQDIYTRAMRADGWIPEGFLTYFGIDGADTSTSERLSNEIDLLVQSVHHFSTRPVVVTNFGSSLPAEWTPERFPQLILMHARPVNGHGGGKSFNFNKFRSMLFTKVAVGLVLDADQWINNGTDYMFRRAAEEGGPAYPYPIQPVHWMSRDPESDDMARYPPGYTFLWQPQEEAAGAPKRSMRWGHAHPSWTHDSLDFLARWTIYALSDPNARSDQDPGAPEWLRYHMNTVRLEDEDLLNFALWAEGQAKMWCKYDIPGQYDFQRYLSQTNDVALFHDDKWFPRGIPLVFFEAHDAKDPAASYLWLQQVWNITDDRPAILYDGRWFRTGKDLAVYDPELKCLV